MIIKTLTLDQAQTRLKEFSNAYWIGLSSMYFGENTEKLDFSELVEGRFFDKTGELRILREQDSWNCILCSDAENSDHVDEIYCCESVFGEQFTVRRYLSYDEDGQAQISYTRLVAREGRN